MTNPQRKFSTRQSTCEVAFGNFLEKYYLLSERESLNHFLKKADLYGPLTQCIGEYYDAIRSNDNIIIHTQLVLTIHDCIITVNTFLKSILNPEAKRQKELTLIEMGIKLIKETFMLSLLSKEKYFSTLKYTIGSVYRKYNWKFDELDRLLDLDKIEKSQIQQIVNGSQGLKKITYLSWNGIKPLDFFIDDFKRHFKITKTKSVQYLFQPVITEFSIQIHPSKLPNLLILFDILHERHTLKLNGTRGLFTYIQKHIIPSTGLFPQKEFRKIKFDILRNEGLFDATKSALEKDFGSYISFLRSDDKLTIA